MSVRLLLAAALLCLTACGESSTQLVRANDRAAGPRMSISAQGMLGLVYSPGTSSAPANVEFFFPNGTQFTQVVHDGIVRPTVPHYPALRFSLDQLDQASSTMGYRTLDDYGLVFLNQEKVIFEYTPASGSSLDVSNLDKLIDMAQVDSNAALNSLCRFGTEIDCGTRAIARTALHMGSFSQVLETAQGGGDLYVIFTGGATPNDQVAKTIKAEVQRVAGSRLTVCKRGFGSSSSEFENSCANVPDKLVFESDADLEFFNSPLKVILDPYPGPTSGSLDTAYHFDLLYRIFDVNTRRYPMPDPNSAPPDDEKICPPAGLSFP